MLEVTVTSDAHAAGAPRHSSGDATRRLLALRCGPMRSAPRSHAAPSPARPPHLPALLAGRPRIPRNVTVDASAGRTLFYVFVERDAAPADGPIVLWLNGWVLKRVGDAALHRHLIPS
jgi:hypothetical protein